MPSLVAAISLGMVLVPMSLAIRRVKNLEM
jgi:hypothetical protein